MTIDNDNEVQQLQAIGRVVGEVRDYMGSMLEPGITTGELDDLGAKRLRELGAISAPQLVYNFPGATCISVNEEAAHGIPGDRRIEAGDVVNIDVSAAMNGFFADTGASFVVPPATAENEWLLEAGRAALEAALNELKSGVAMRRIGFAIERIAKRYGCGVIENLGSHGIGRNLHEDPRFIPGHYVKDDRRVLKKGLVLTVEPFLTTGPTYADQSGDGWTLIVPATHRVAQFEHTVIITDNGFMQLT